MDPELVKTVFAVVRDRWLEGEEAIATSSVYRELKEAEVPISRGELEEIWDYLEDLEAVELDVDDNDETTIVDVDPDWSPPHTNVMR